MGTETAMTDDMLIEDDFGAADLDEWVSVWLDVLLEDIANSPDWTAKLIRGDKRASPTNVRFS